MSKSKLKLIASLSATAATLYGGAEAYERGWFFKKTDSPKKRRDIYLASNSLLYAIDRNSTQASKPPIVVLVPMWLERTDKSFHRHNWGQTSLCLPSAPRSIFNALFPNHPQENYLLWEQVLAIREQQINSLKKKAIEGTIVLHDLRDRNIHQYETRKLLSLEDSENSFVMKVDGKPLFEVPKNELGNVYNFLSLPRSMPEELSKKGLNTRPHTELYYKPSSSAPKSVLISGTGLSSVWIRKHFPDIEHLFIIAKDKKSTLPKIPSNEDVDYNSINYAHRLGYQ